MGKIPGTLIAWLFLCSIAFSQEELVGTDGAGAFDKYPTNEVLQEVLSDDVPKNTGTASAGLSNLASRADHVHFETSGGANPLSDSTPQPVSETGSSGSGTSVSRDDHVHSRDSQTSTNTTGIANNVTNIATNTTGISTNKTAIEGKQDTLPSYASNAGKVLTVNRGENGLEWTVKGGGGGGGGGLAPSLLATITIPQNSNSNRTEEVDRTACLNSDTIFLLRRFGASAAGFPVWNSGFHDNSRTALTNTTKARGSFSVTVSRLPAIFLWDCQNTPYQMQLTLDNNARTPSAITVEVYGINLNGGGGGASLSDATPKNIGTANAGTGTSASRDDHVHADNPNTLQNITRNSTSIATNTRDIATNKTAIPGASDTLPTQLGSANAGSNSTYSRSDHRHPTTGIRQYPNFTSGNSNDCFRVNSAGSAVGWRDCPSGGGDSPSPSTATPKDWGTAAPGSSTDYSRGDHVHPAHVIRNVPEIAALTNRDQCLRVSALGTSYGWANCQDGNRQLPAATVATKIDIPRIKSDGTGYEVVDPHVAVLSGLPATTGQANKVLTVNSAATGVEWKDAGGGSGGSSAGITWEKVYTASKKATRPGNNTFEITTLDLTDKCNAADYIAFNDSAFTSQGNGLLLYPAPSLLGSTTLQHYPYEGLSQIGGYELSFLPSYLR